MKVASHASMRTLASNPQHPCKRLDVAMNTCMLVLERRRQEDTRGLLAGLPKWVRPRFNEGHCLKKKKKR